MLQISGMMVHVFNFITCFSIKLIILAVSDKDFTSFAVIDFIGISSEFLVFWHLCDYVSWDCF